MIILICLNAFLVVLNLPQRKTPQYVAHQKAYLAARKKGWKPLATMVKNPMEKSIVARSLRIVLSHGVGSERTQTGTARAIEQIIPIIAGSLKEQVRSKVTPEASDAFNRMIDWFSRNPRDFSMDQPVHWQIRELAQKISNVEDARIKGVISKMGLFFDPSNEGRWDQKNNPTFEELLEFQIRHDIFHSVVMTSMFFYDARNNPNL